MKKEKELKIVNTMIKMYCHKKHKTKKNNLLKYLLELKLYFLCKNNTNI